ncbi:PWWP domain-containing protein 2A [Paragonimus heterotremus]|uniref:PWWP domain-containing protein 2A n=1 Tax=Paragonimus heterotremus TaxID=100268 RepID=A0A8J4WVQ5_9TREM|nr:PWWP domain-containing protein 2A [Paragonimus heterotremus]
MVTVWSMNYLLPVPLSYPSSFNQYGINPDRVRGAPFWSPLTTPTAGLNLKTIPCSTERYSYKLDGQPSTLSVFQPEAIKRSNRNQPAPQLSRILRPRRFVCRKCKKAYHVEENGIELSSTALSFLAGRSNADSSAVTSDSENQPVSSSAYGNGKSVRRNHFTSSTNTENAQSIRHVTPSIIPKLTEDYGLSGRESEGDSNSDDTVTSKSKRAQVKEKRPVGLAVITTDKLVLQTKRKIHSSDPVHRPKKIKRISTSESRNTSIPKEITTVPLDSASYEAVHTQPAVDHPIPSVGSHSHKPVHLVQSAPVKSDDVQIRKNRIKAQYVSVATPFRFPPSRSSKPNLLSISQLTGTSREKTKVVPKRVVRPEEQHIDDNKTELLKITDSAPSRKKPHGSKSSSKKQCSNVDSPSLSARLHSRARTGQYDEPQCLDSTSMQSVPEVQVTSRQTVYPSDSSLSPRNSRSVKNEDSLSRRTSEVPDVTPVAHSSDSGPHITDHPEINHDLVVCSVQQSNDSTNTSVISNCGRLKAVDYEKPKNRWIREARARRSQEERTSTVTSMPLPVVSTNSNTSVCSAASGLHPCESDSSIPTPVSPLAISRLRSRSSDLGMHANTSAVDSPSKLGSAPKRRSGPTTANNSDVTTVVNVIAPDPNEEALQASDTQLVPTHLSPRSTPLSDSSGSCLPVLKIKINRNRPLSTTDANKSAEYEVVEMQVSGYDAGCAMSVGSGVATTAKSDSVAVTPTDTPSGIFESKLEHSVNGSWTSSPSPSVSSSRKGMPFTDSVAPGLPVKRCKLSDGVVFRVGDLVWSKLSGWPSWPAQITSIHRIASDELECGDESDTPNGTQLKSSPVPASKRPSYTACLHWFAWHQVSYIHCDKLFHFLQHYKRFDNKKKRGIFRQAVNEALQKSKEKQAAPLSSAEDSFDEQEDDVVANLTSAVSEVVAVSSSVTPSSCINTVSEALLEPHVPAVLEPVEIKHATESSSLPDSSSFPPPLPALHVRRGLPSRGRVRGLKGRRGSSSHLGAPVRTSPRNLSTLLPTEIHNEFSYDFCSDSTPALPARTNATGRGRGRGRARGRGRTFTVVNKRTFTVQPDTGCLSIVTPPESIGTLKIVLSKNKVRQSASVKRKKDNTVKNVRKSNSCLSASLLKQPGNVADKQYDSPSDTRQLQTDVAVDSCKDLPVSGESIGESTAVPRSSYGDPSADLLSQFPQVFPDLRASGILSDTVDIPTFSEDESEEEDAGRLIIDPDVMASVNASGSSAREATTSLTQLNRTDPTESRKDCYNVQYFSAVRSLNAPQSHLSAPFGTTSCVDKVPNPMLPSSSCVSGSNTQSTVPVRVGFPTSHLAGSTAPCRSTPVPAVQPLTQLLHPSPHQLLTRDTFDPIHRLTYFQPSSHKSVPVTASNSNVPYMTTDYPTL